MFREYLESFGDAPMFSYQGSKTRIRQWVISFMPLQGRWYIEAFGGRGNMFFLAKKTLNFKKWHLNDLNSAPFFHGISQVNPDDFPHKMTQKKFDQYKSSSDDPLSKVIEPGISFLGHYRGGWSGKYSGGGKQWDKEYYKKNVMDAKEQLEDVKITNLSWDKLPYNMYIKEDFVYFDPPYLDTDNRYYSDIDHNKFLSTVKSLKSKWMVSMTYHPLYIKMLGKPFQVKERSASIKTIKNKGAKLIECLWKGNY